MGRVIIVASGKGGVGKTTITANLGIALARLGKMVCVIDADLSLNNLDVALGLENRVVYDLLDVIKGKCRISQAIVEDPSLEGFYLLPCVKQSAGAEISKADFKRVIKSLQGAFDFVLIDAPAGLEYSFERAQEAANEALIVVTPTLSSIRDAKKVIDHLMGEGKEVIKFILNRTRGDLVKNGVMITEKEVAEILDVEPAGVIPENDNLLLNNSFASLLFTKDTEISSAFTILGNNIINNTSLIYDYLKKYNKFWGLIKNSFKNIG